VDLVQHGLAGNSEQMCGLVEADPPVGNCRHDPVPDGLVDADAPRRARGELFAVAGYLAGSVVEQSRRCGKAGCRCASGGELHGPYVYLSVRRAGARRGMLYVPETLAAVLRQRVALSESVQQLLANISAVNLELLTRRALT
jgi:hypothetical protein